MAKVIIGGRVIASTDTWQKEGTIKEAKKVRDGNPGRGEDLSNFYEIVIELSDGTTISGKDCTWFPL